MKFSNLAILGALALATTFDPKEGSSQEAAQTQTFNDRLTIKEAPHLRDDLVSPPPKNALEAQQAELARRVASCVLLKGEQLNPKDFQGYQGYDKNPKKPFTNLVEVSRWKLFSYNGFKYDLMVFNATQENGVIQDRIELLLWPISTSAYVYEGLLTKIPGKEIVSDMSDVYSPEKLDLPYFFNAVLKQCSPGPIS